jgi:hypothetical protein
VISAADAKIEDVMSTTQLVLYVLVTFTLLFAILAPTKKIQRVLATCLLALSVGVFVLSSAAARVAIDATSNPAFRQGVAHLANQERHFFVANLLLCVALWLCFVFKKN